MHPLRCTLQMTLCDSQNPMCVLECTSNVLLPLQDMIHRRRLLDRLLHGPRGEEVLLTKCGPPILSEVRRGGCQHECPRLEQDSANLGFAPPRRWYHPKSLGTS